MVVLTTKQKVLSVKSPKPKPPLDFFKCKVIWTFKLYFRTMDLNRKEAAAKRQFKGHGFLL